MSSIATELAALLSTVRRPGDFYVSGTIEMLAPRLEVDGVGLIALPLLPVQAEQLVAAAERAPYGRGPDTLIDTEVRRTWQIGADRVRIQGKHWAGTLETILERVADGLGLSEPPTAELYKLLVYDQGSFFLSHRDTEKAPGMFGTLVVVLPSVSTGGELVVRHKGREARLDLCCEDPSEAAFAAFYADCVHEVLPVTSGCRLTLVYNLLRRGKGPAPRPPNYESQQARVAALLRKWSAGRPPGDEAPLKLIYPLEHAYTQAELGFDALKGADAAAAGVLAAAAPRAGCDLHLALLSIEESGSADHLGGYRYGRWSEPEEDEFEVVEVLDRYETLSEWRRPDGQPSRLGPIPVDEDEVSPPDALDDLEPDEQHFREASGNEGASFERSYRRAALVLWPREQIHAVLNQAGLSVTLPYLGDLAERWAAGGANQQSPLWQQAHELSRHMIARWPRDGWMLPRDKPSDATRMLRLLVRLDDTARIDAFLAGIAATGLCNKADNDAVLEALDLLPPRRAAALIRRIVTGTAAASFAACADLLARAAAARPRGRRRDLVKAAAALVDALPGDPARTVAHDPWQRPVAVDAGFVADLFTALVSIDEALAERAAEHVLAWPRTYGLDAVLVPAACSLMGSAETRNSAAVQRLRTACLEHLRARIALPLEPPRDWTRASEVGCKCPRCSELSRFLADPERETWVFKAAEADRGHVESTIRTARCDVDVTTDRRGRPYSLVCTKNQASYERRVKQRKKDLADLARPEG